MAFKGRGRDFLGKVVVSEETGRKFGVVGDLKFVAESGELMSIVVTEPTKHVAELSLEKDENSRLLIPFSTVKSVGDFVIVSEKEIS
jgi:sporulation protein YlmC with PRC-barrel domain